MMDIINFLIGSTITLLASAVVVLFIRRHLRNVLIDLTGTRERAEFWTTFTGLLLVIIPLIVAMFVPPRGDPDIPALFRITSLLRWSLIGLTGTLVSCGLVIIWFVQTRPPQRSSQESPIRD